MANKIIVFDIDGTLADIKHRKHWVTTHPKNWAAFNASMDRDEVHGDIRWLLTVLHRQGNTIILCSGRGEETREVSEKWLTAHSISWSAFYMRKSKDYRKDSIVKVELLQEIRKTWGEPYLWFDDRDQVVEAIRAQGVRVLQVAPGDF
jgi:phosphoglycolate phosphatase-like HAD superfamily hydrolase